MTAPGSSAYVVGTWTFTDPDVPLGTACYELRLDAAATVRQISASAAAVYYSAVEPGDRSILLLHNDIHRSAMSRHRFAADGSLVEEGRWSSGGQGGSYIAFDPSGRYFVVANAHTGWAVFRNGTEPELIASMRNEGSGPHPGKSAPIRTAPSSRATTPGYTRPTWAPTKSWLSPLTPTPVASATRSAPTVPPPDQGHGTYCPGTA